MTVEQRVLPKALKGVGEKLAPANFREEETMGSLIPQLTSWF